MKRHFLLKILIFFYIFLFLVLFVSCSGNLQSTNNALSSKEWKANRLSIDTKILFAPQNATMIFDTQQNRIYGNSGCNNYTANYEQEKNHITIKRRTFTRKFCESQETMEYEFEFLRNLEGEYEIINLKEYKNRLSTYEQITNTDLYEANVPQNMLILYNRFKAYFLLP